MQKQISTTSALDQHTMSTKPPLPLNRIKRIMQSNKEIGKIKASTPLVIAKALELFIADITASASQIAIKNGDSKVAPGHVRAVIDGKGAQQYFAFLKEAVSKVPDMKVNNDASAGGLYEAADIELAA